MVNHNILIKQLTIRLIIFKDINYCGFPLNKIFVENFWGYGQPAKFLPHVATRCVSTRQWLDAITFTKIFLMHTIGKTLQSQENSIMTMIIFLWLLLKMILLLNLLISDNYSPEDIALDKLPVGDGKAVLTSHLKYFHRAIPHTRCSMKKSRTAIQEITRIFNLAI